MSQRARAAIGREWLNIIDVLIEDTAQKYDEAQETGRDDLQFFYAGKRSCLNYFRELAEADIGMSVAASVAKPSASGEIAQTDADT